MDKYTLDELIEKFEKHAIKNEKLIKENRKKFPGSEWDNDDFNISKALYSIVCEIEDINCRIADMQ